MYLGYYGFCDAAKMESLVSRRLSDDEAIKDSVAAIIKKVREEGDKALFEYEEKFDASTLDSLLVSEAEFEAAEKEVPEELKDAIEVAYANIYAFHKAEVPQGEEVETMEGIKCWRKIVPISRVGLYVPGGSAPLFSTVLMLAIPAGIAGCETVMATPSRGGKVNSAVLYAAKRCGVKEVVKLGGAQAIAALAYGSESVGKVDKIFGPGNRYVSYAKQLVSSDVAIDMVAGPSEVMVVCDRTADPAYVASDLLSQAEHGKDSQVVLLIKADDEKEAEAIHEKVEAALEAALSILGRHEYMLPSLSHSAAFAAKKDEELLDLINAYAPEHLIINTENYMDLLDGVKNAGSVFLGPYSPESAGDYASGTNHTLPTSAWARSTGGVSLDSFIKKITVQHLTKEGLDKIAKTVTVMAEAEELFAHSQAVKVRVL